MDSMKRLVFSMAALMAVTSSLAQDTVVIEPTRPASRVRVQIEAEPEEREPIDAVLIVQNHASDDFQKPLSNLGDQLSQALSGDLFNVIDPNDAIGDEQNRGPWGENMPVSAATRLAENLEAQTLLTAAVGETSVIGYGAPAKVQAVRMSLTLSAKRLPKGANVASVTVTETSRKVTPDTLSQNAEAIYGELVRTLVAKASSQFLAKCEDVKWKDVVLKLVEVGFGCNFPGADVSIDGVSYGTAGTIGEPPLKVKVSDGLHNLKISYPYAIPYEVRARLQEGTTFIAVLHLNDEGRQIRKEDKYFDTLMDRIEKSGATDDQVRMIRARGYGKYLSSSYTRLHGMPQVLSIRDCDMPDFGLNPDREGDGVQTSTRDLFDQAGSAAGLQLPQRSGDGKSGKRDDDSNGRDRKDGRKRDSSDENDRDRHSDDRQSEDDWEPPDNTDVGVVMPLQQSQQAAPVQQTVPAQSAQSAYAQPVATPAYTAPTTQPRNEALQNLHDIREGVDTGKDIIQGIKDIGDMLK